LTRKAFREAGKDAVNLQVVDTLVILRFYFGTHTWSYMLLAILTGFNEK